MTNLPIEGTYADFISALSRGPHSIADLQDAASGLRERIDDIDRQIKSGLRDQTWEKSATTALKYYSRKAEAVTAALAARIARSAVDNPPAKKKVPGPQHGVLATFVHDGEFVPMATRLNIADLCSRLLVEAVSSGEAPPLLVAYINLTEQAAAELPEEIWVDEVSGDGED